MGSGVRFNNSKQLIVIRVAGVCVEEGVKPISIAKKGQQFKLVDFRGAK